MNHLSRVISVTPDIHISAGQNDAYNLMYICRACFVVTICCYF
jgi:hypothetical protein